MDIEPTDTTPVDSGSDDLGAFEKDFFSETPKAEPAKEEVTPEPETEATPEEEATSEDEPESPEDEDAPKEKPQPKKNRFNDRIAELTAKAKEAERALEALRAEKSTQPETPKTPAPVVQGPAPTDKNSDGSEKYPLGEFDPEYIRDMARHTIDTEWNARKAEEAKQQSARQEQEARDHLQNQWVEKLAPVTEQHEDFLDKTLELESTFEGLDPQYSDYLAQTIKSLEHGPEVLYYFANHLDEAEKFVKAGPLGATLALGEINAMFKGQTRKEAKVSSAPPPPQTNKGSNIRTTVRGDTEDLDAFEKEFFKKK